MRKHDAASLKRGTSLAGAVAKAGSPAALARLLGVRPETVRSWQRSGITKGGQKLLAELSERQKLTRAEAKGKRQTFDLMFKLAGERGDLRRSRSKEGVRAGPRTSGYSYTRAIGEMLTHELIAEIDAWMLSRRRRFPFFQAVAVATEYTKQRFKGYKTVIRQVAGVEESGDFAVEEQIATRRSAKLSEVRGELTAKLEDAIEEGALVYIHEVTLHNYRLRTDEERLAWESGKRSLRRKKAKRKARKTPPSGGAGATPRVEKEPKKTWPKKKPKKASTSKNSSVTSRKKPAEKPTKVTRKKSSVLLTKKSTKRGASPVKSASTRSRTTPSSSKRASVKVSRPKTFASRSPLTKSKKSTKKQKSSSRVTPKNRTSKTLAKKTHQRKLTVRTSSKKQTTSKTKRTSKATSSRRNRK